MAYLQNDEVGAQHYFKTHSKHTPFMFQTNTTKKGQVNQRNKHTHNTLWGLVKARKDKWVELLRGNGKSERGR